MRILERLYRSKLGRMMSFIVRQEAKLNRPFMVYGYYDYPSRTFRKYTRMSNTVLIMNRKGLSIDDHVWVGHHSILDATHGLVIREGCQISAWVGIFTHGAENSLRLLGKKYVDIPHNERKEYSLGRVEIGVYTFVGARAVILPGVKVGKGCIIGAGSVVTKDVPDYSFVIGIPGRVSRSTIDIDKECFKNEDFSNTYYDLEALALIKTRLASEIDKSSK